MKAKILADIKKAEKLGLKVQGGSFGSQLGMCCCPMTAVALAAVSPDKLCYVDGNRFRESLVLPAVYKRLGVDEPLVLGFIHGFDSLKRTAASTKATYKAGFALGREIRKERDKS